MNQSEFAARHSVSRKTVTLWKKRGWLVFTGDDIEPDASDALLHKYRKGGTDGLEQGNTDLLPDPKVTEQVTDFDGVLPGESTEDAAFRMLSTLDPMTIDVAKLMKETYLAKLAQPDDDIASGRVVEAAEVAAIVGSEYTVVRTKLLAIPAEQAPRINRCRSTAEIQDTLREIITRVLEELTAGKQ